MSVEVYMIKWENIPFLFSTLAAAKESIGLTYPDHLVMGVGGQDGTHTFDVSLDGKIQDRVTVLEMGVHNEGIKLPGVPVSTTPGRARQEF